MTGQEPRQFLCIPPETFVALIGLVVPHGWDSNGRRCGAGSWRRDELAWPVPGEEIEFECICGRAEQEVLRLSAFVEAIPEAFLMKRID